MAARCLRRDLDTVDLVPSMAAITLCCTGLWLLIQKIKNSGACSLYRQLQLLSEAKRK